MTNRTLCTFIAFLPCLYACLATAQDDEQTAEQEAEIRSIADGIQKTCMAPTGPVIPDGATATQAEMVAAQGALKTFLEAGNDYLGCLEEVETGWGTEATVNQVAVMNFLYNGMVENLQGRAEAFNAALSEFRSKDTE
jgi:hypothetical protein